jgi:DNA processing protein
VRARRLLEHFGDPSALATAPPEQLRAEGVPRAGIDALQGETHLDGIDVDLAWAAEPGNHLIPRNDPRYPARLATIEDPPPLLYGHGDAELLGQPALAIVGTRSPTSAGIDIAEALARHLAERGLVVTSGLALGIDAAAHRGALAAHGMTIAVAGTGLDRVYPARNADLARQIGESGALLSELPLGTRPSREAFPRRNRILAGLTLGTLVVEAATRSGSLITARLALEQGREVFAVPGSIHNPVARGCHRLIRQGAKLVETADDILEEIAPRLAAASPADAASTDAAETGESAGGDNDDDYARLMEVLDWEPRGVDDLAARSGLDAGQVASMLLRLELEGAVRAAAGGMYQRP